MGGRPAASALRPAERHAVARPARRYPGDSAVNYVDPNDVDVAFSRDGSRMVAELQHFVPGPRMGRVRRHHGLGPGRPVRAGVQGPAAGVRPVGPESGRRPALRRHAGRPTAPRVRRGLRSPDRVDAQSTGREARCHRGGPVAGRVDAGRRRAGSRRTGTTRAPCASEGRLWTVTRRPCTTWCSPTTAGCWRRRPTTDRAIVWDARTRSSSIAYRAVTASVGRLLRRRPDTVHRREAPGCSRPGTCRAPRQLALGEDSSVVERRVRAVPARPRRPHRRAGAGRAGCGSTTPRPAGGSASPSPTRDENFLWSPDARWLLSVGTDNVVTVWDASTGAPSLPAATRSRSSREPQARLRFRPRPGPRARRHRRCTP